MDSTQIAKIIQKSFAQGVKFGMDIVTSPRYFGATDEQMKKDADDVAYNLVRTIMKDLDIKKNVNKNQN